MTGPQLLSVAAVAERLSVSIWTVYRILERNELNYCMIQGRRRVDVRDLERYIDVRKVAPEGYGTTQIPSLTPRPRRS